MPVAISHEPAGKAATGKRKHKNRQFRRLNRLDAASADLVRRRLEDLEEVPGLFAGVSLEDWARFCQQVCPERFGQPRALPQEPTTLTGPAKADVLVDRLTGGTLRRQDPLAQTCLWHFLDHDSRPDYGALAGSARRRRPPVLTIQQRIEQGERPPTFWHLGMVRFEDAMADNQDGFCNAAKGGVGLVRVFSLTLTRKVALE